MKLLVDIGNRRLKWATTSDGVFDDAGAFVHVNTPDLTAEWGELKRPDSVWICCVADAKIRATVADFARQKWALQANFITAQKRAAGVVNAYPKPATLGGDRWAALLAAAALYPRQSLIIVDAGTAVTVDLLGDDGVHQGGVILPGVSRNVGGVARPNRKPRRRGFGGRRTAGCRRHRHRNRHRQWCVTGSRRRNQRRRRPPTSRRQKPSHINGRRRRKNRTATGHRHGITTEPQLVLKGIAILAQ